MSGGSLGYAYCHVNDARGRIRERCDLLRACPEEWDTWEHEHLPRALRRYDALAAHLELVSDALYEVEWAFSSDTHIGCDRERAALDALLGPEVLP